MDTVSWLGVRWRFLNFLLPITAGATLHNHQQPATITPTYLHLPPAYL
jgi:hypothetical protein